MGRQVYRCNSSVIVTGFGKRCNLVREGKTFFKDKAKISSKVGVSSEQFFCELGFESDEQKFAL